MAGNSGLLCCCPSSAHGGRALAFVLGLIGLYCSYVVTQSCEFLHFKVLEDNDNRTSALDELPFPFNNVPITTSVTEDDGDASSSSSSSSVGDVGLFSYRHTIGGNVEEGSNITTTKEDSWKIFSYLPWKLDHSVCTRYEKQFFKLVGELNDDDDNDNDANAIEGNGSVNSTDEIRVEDDDVECSSLTDI